MELYGVYHEYDVDGGFGDAIGQETLVTIFPSEKEAKEYCERWNDPHVYDVSYAELCDGRYVPGLSAPTSGISSLSSKVRATRDGKRGHSNATGILKGHWISV